MTVSEMLRATGNAEPGVNLYKKERMKGTAAAATDLMIWKAAQASSVPVLGLGFGFIAQRRLREEEGEAKGWRSRSRATTTTMFLALAGLALGRPLAGLCWD
jgi:hypothetical protein